MDSAETLIDPHSEVKKLQELVKKLEKQNELLRTKQKLPLQNGEVDKVLSNHNNNFTTTNSDSATREENGVPQDETDLIDINTVSLRDEEDSWLYSPKPLTPQQSKVSPYKWMRRDFDHPSPEVESARRSLLSRLDEVARINRSSSTPALGSYVSPTRSSALSRSTEESSTPTHTHGQRPQIKQSLLSTGRVDSGTFTRPKKNRPPLVEKNPSLEGDGGEEAAPHRVPNVSDIETLAKLQEESLRQSISPFQSPRKGMKSRHTAQVAASDTDNSGSPVGSNRSSPGRFDEGGYHRNSVGSDASSPPDSPYASQHLHPTNNAQQTPESQGMRRSLPNVSRLQYPSPAIHSSDSSLDHHSVGSDENNLAPEARPSSRLAPAGLRAPSPGLGGLKQPGQQMRRAASPQRATGLPQPARRSIPRPTTPARSGIPAPRRSNIPSPRPPSSQGSEESWREGCF